MTVGILFMTDERIAAIKPIPIVAAYNPWLAVHSITFVKTEVSPAFRSPYTTTYIPIEKKTIAQGAPFNTVTVSTAGLLLAINRKVSATAPAINETGTASVSLRKYPTIRMLRTAHEIRNIFTSFNASAGFLSNFSSKCFGIDFLK